VLNDILDVSKVEAGKVVLESVNFDLFREIEKAFLVFVGKAKEKSLELLLRFDPRMKRFYQGTQCTHFNNNKRHTLKKII
jgi:hypothetical protein